MCYMSYAKVTVRLLKLQLQRFKFKITLLTSHPHAVTSSPSLLHLFSGGLVNPQASLFAQIAVESAVWGPELGNQMVFRTVQYLCARLPRMFCVARHYHGSHNKQQGK